MSTQQWPHLGRLSDATACAVVKGPCGDEMEFYLVVVDDRIVDVRFSTTGCAATIGCGEAVARMVHGMSVDEVLGISPRQVMGRLPGLPPGSSHCVILAVSCLFRAIAAYLLKD